MSHTTRVLGVSGVSVRLTDLLVVLVAVVGVPLAHARYIQYLRERTGGDNA
jgi:hypothetical protein